MDVTVTPGSTVTWKNLDGEPHTVASIDGLFRSQALDQNDSFSFKFDKPGVYRYICSIHPKMRATSRSSTQAKSPGGDPPGLSHDRERRAYGAACRLIEPMPAATFRPLEPSTLSGCRAMDLSKPPTRALAPTPTPTVAWAEAPT